MYEREAERERGEGVKPQWDRQVRHAEGVGEIPYWLVDQWVF